MGPLKPPLVKPDLHVTLSGVDLMNKGFKGHPFDRQFFTALLMVNILFIYISTEPKV